MDKDTDVFLELTDDEHPDADAAAEDTARLLIEVRDRRHESSPDQSNVVEGSSDEHDNGTPHG